MDDNKFDALKIENQLCFPLYACAKEIVKKYKPFLDEIGLTYTQYITRQRSKEDERNLVITITSKGEVLKKRAVHIPEEIRKCMFVSPEEAKMLYGILYKILGQITE